MNGLTYTTRPEAYVTGGYMSARQPAADACHEEGAPWLPIWFCGGPLDATDYMPTGRVHVSHGMLFFTLTHRESTHD